MANPLKPPSLGSTIGSTLGKSPSQPKDISKVGKQGVTAKMPKAKKPGDAFAPPSVFFKSENGEPKHPNLKKLHDFMAKKHKSN
jgi:hypothetical protein